jgi:hypothetical protein
MRRSLFQKYFLVLFAAAIFPMAAGGISNTWFSYVDQHAILSALLRSEATSAADKIESFLDGIKVPLGSAIPQGGSTNASVKQLRLPEACPEKCQPCRQAAVEYVAVSRESALARLPYAGGWAFRAQMQPLLADRLCGADIAVAARTGWRRHSPVDDSRVRRS